MRSVTVNSAACGSSLFLRKATLSALRAAVCGRSARINDGASLQRLVNLTRLSAITIYWGVTSNIWLEDNHDRKCTIFNQYAVCIGRSQ